MALFISYSSRDAAALQNITSALRRARIEAWLDEELAGGEAWWNEILEKIRGCDVFVAALSKNYLDSKPCQAELSYAQALNRPILPVQIGPLDSMRVNPLASVQAIDYQNPSINTGIELIAAVHAGSTRATPLPSPLPESPPVPFAYLLRLSNTIAAPELSAAEQEQLFTDLRSGLETDGDEPSARRDLIQLLIRLRDRRDITYKTRADVENILSSVHGGQSFAPPRQADTGPAPVFRQGAPGPARPEPQQWYGAVAPPYPYPIAGQRPKKSRKPLIIGGVVVAAAAALIVVIAAIKPTPAPPPPAPAKVDSSQLNSILLSTERIKTIMGGSDMQANTVIAKMSPDTAQVSPPSCLGVMYTAQNTTYAGAGWSAVADQTVLQKASEQNPDLAHLFVDQTAVSFSTADRAEGFFKASADSWKGCAGQSLSETNTNNEQSHWQMRDLTQADKKLVLFGTQDSGNGWGCQHALRVVSNLVVEAVACSLQINDQASQIADEMIGNLPR